MEVDQCVFRFVDIKAAADKVRNRIYIIPVHDGGTDTLRSGSFTDNHFLKTAIRVFLEYVFTPVIGYIDKRRFVFHQGIEVLVQRLNALSLQGRQYLERDQGILGPGNGSYLFYAVKHDDLQ